MSWQPIATAPRDGRQPVLLIGQYPIGRGWSDIYHGWWDGKRWARWPHEFEPTHWQPHSTPSSDDRSRQEYGTAREVSSDKDAQTAQMIAELCEALEESFLANGWAELAQSHSEDGNDAAAAKWDAKVQNWARKARAALRKAKGTAG